jgi:hypothetical protein
MNKAMAQKQRRDRRAKFRSMLKGAGIEFKIFNNDLHWRLVDYGIDLWPTSGKMCMVGSQDIKVVTPKQLLDIISIKTKPQVENQLIVSIFDRGTGEVYDIYKQDELNQYLAGGFEVIT